MGYTLHPMGVGFSPSRWLLVCIALLVLMVALGGYTRLSGSGLSITEWKPVHGVLPPLSTAAWEEEFAAYRTTPQFAQVNPDMTLEGFRAIFWPEYLHRLLGRIIGVVFLLPLVWFARKGLLSKRQVMALLGIFALGGLQGGMGWFMVQSGLVDDPYVSHIRLAMHLALALLIIGLLEWVWLSWRPRALRPVHGLVYAVFPLLCAQMLYGAFLAGTHGGLIYNTFPSMNYEWVPTGIWPETAPWWQVLTDHIPAIQFIHRWLGMSVGALVVVWAALSRTRLAWCVLVAALMQIMMGIATLLYQVPLPLALAHQLIGLMLFMLMVAALRAKVVSV